MAATCKSCGQVVTGNHECPGMWKLEDGEVWLESDTKVKDHLPGLHHVVTTIKVGASPVEDALNAFKEISAILEKLSYEVRPRVLKALNEIYREDGR